MLLLIFSNILSLNYQLIRKRIFYIIFYLIRSYLLLCLTYKKRVLFKINNRRYLKLNILKQIL